jgi:hypothetical protein
MNTLFTVVKSTPSNEGKTHVWKLEVVVSDVVVFGLKKTVKRTYYIGGMPAAGVVGKQFEEDLAKFEVVNRPFTHPDSNEEILLKWLHVKVA